MLYSIFFLPIYLGAALVSATTPTRTAVKRSVSSQFVSTSGGQFYVNGSELKFVGTNAYWLPTLNTEQDMEDTFSNMSSAGVRVVRTWAFNDVTAVPENGTWFQLIANGTTSINNGTSGLPRLDTLVSLAEKYGIYILFSLTNNWNPLPADDVANSTSTIARRDVLTNNTLTRNTLSNDYGGMDTYVREFGVSHLHDEFYTNETIVNIFKNYTLQVISRYVNSPAIFAWELANDPRCNSSLPAASTCNPETVTTWHAGVAQYVASIDPNHLISTGNQGFFCTGCPKLYPLGGSPAAASPSPQPSMAKRRLDRKGPLTKAQVLKERVKAWRKTRELKKRSGELPESGIRIRGRWTATPTKRQDTSLGSAYDGSQGVDSEDIINIPQISFGSFQLFPDQDQYGTPDPNLSPFANTVELGIQWIAQQAQTAQIYGKPMSLTGFGLVTQQNAPDYVPFNTTVAPFGPDESLGSSNVNTTQSESYGVTSQEQSDAYEIWLKAGIRHGVNGMLQYQWGQSNLTVCSGTTISPNTTGQSPTVNTTGESPNDGYGNLGQAQNTVQQIMSDSAQQLGSAPDA